MATTRRHDPSPRAHRRALTIIGALLVAGCVVGPSGSPGSTGARSSPAPSACPTSLPPDLPTVGAVTFAGLRGGDWAQVNPTRVTAVGRSENLIEPTPDPGVWSAGIYAGDAPIAFAFAIDNVDVQPAIEVQSIEATYLGPEGGPARPIRPTTTTSREFAIVLPDGSGPAELDLTVTWRAGCFVVVGTTRIGLGVVSAAAVAACPTDGDALSAMLRAHDDDQLLIGSVSRPIGTLSFLARYGMYGGADEVPAFATWDPASPVVTGPAGGVIRLTDDDGELELTGGSARFYPRSPEDGSPQSVPEPPIIDVGADAGILTVVLPSAPGRYVLEVSTSWLLPCLEGSGLAYFNLTTG